MVLLAVLAFVGWLFTGVLCAEFLNPPNMGKTVDFSTNPTYVSGEVLNVVWDESEEGQKCSLVLYQVNITTGRDFGDWEFLTREWHYTWTRCAVD
jgi:Na+-transporting NADH:ubiquinone oxidoreductase subunit NqrB